MKAFALTVKRGLSEVFGACKKISMVTVTKKFETLYLSKSLSVLENNQKLVRRLLQFYHMHEIVRIFCISFSPVCFHFFFYYKIEHKNLFTDAVFVINYFSLKFPQLFL